MKILAIDSTAKMASVALAEDEKILGEFYIHTSLTHSQTLVPMVADLLKNAGVSIGEIELFAASVGPGSFTGVRIGVSALKGMALPKNTPCAAVSTLEAMAQNLRSFDCEICCVMDARCNQVYQAFFSSRDGQIIRKSDDRAILIEDLRKDIEKYPACVHLVGDGADLCYNKLGLKNVKNTAEPVKYQRASGVARVAFRKYQAGEIVPAARLNPVYLRMPQAERELKKRVAGCKEGV